MSDSKSENRPKLIEVDKKKTGDQSDEALN
jgi:hypothetical protein